MILTKIKIAATLLLTVGLIGVGVGLLTGQSSPKGAPSASAQEKGPEKEAANPKAESALPTGALAQLGTSRFRHAYNVRAVAFSPDRKIIASGSQKNTIRFWDAETGQELRVLTGHTSSVVGLSFSPDGKTLASCSWDRSVRLWEVETGKAIRTLAGHTGGVGGVAFAPDGKTLLSASSDGTARVWDAATGNELLQLKGHEGSVEAAAFARDGKLVATGGLDKTVRLWDAATGKELRKIEGHVSRLRGVAFSPDGKRLVSGGWDTTARLWDVETGKQLDTLKHTSGLEDVGFSPDGKSVVTAGGWDDVVHVWDVTGETGRIRWSGKIGQPFVATYSDDGKRLAAGGWDNTVHIWDAATGKEVGPGGSVGHNGWVCDVHFLPDRKTLVSASSFGQVILWDTQQRKEVRRLQGTTSRIWCLAVSPDGKTLAVGNHDQTVQLWDVGTFKAQGTIKTNGSVKGLAFSPDSKHLAAVSGEAEEDGSAKPITGQAGAGIWEVATGKSFRRLEGHEGAVRGVSYAPDGKTIATAGADGSVRIWDAMNGKQLHKLESHIGAVVSVAFSPDGKLLASAGQESKERYAQAGLARLWRLGTDDKPMSLGKPTGIIHKVTFSPDGRTLLTAARAAGQPKLALRLWDVATGKERIGFAGHQETATGVAFSADGRMIASGGGDGLVLLWDVTGRVQNGKFATAELSQAALEAAWADLVGDDAAKAHRSIWALTAAPKQTLPLLGDYLKPVPPGDAKRIAQLVKELDDDKFETREKASAALEKIGEPAAPALRKVLEGAPSAEVRNRVTRLLDAFTGQGPSEILRRARALEVLENLGGAEARAILEKLAEGAPEAALTQQAKAALQRLTK